MQHTSANDTAGASTPSPKAVFEGIRVLDVGHIVAGPLAASVMADFGAEVLKIEMPKAGDPLRKMHPKDGVGLYFKVQARNKKSITLNLKSPEGVEIFKRLVAESDVVVENYRPGVMERLGLGWDTLSSINPRIVLCRLSSYGQTGVNKDRRAYGRVGEAFGGFAHLTGEADGPPMHSTMALGDTVAGVWAAMGVMMALYWRDAQGGGVGQVIDIGLYEGIYRQIEQQIIVADQLGVPISRAGNFHRNIPYTGSFKTRDNRYYTFSAFTDKSALDVLRPMGMEEDARFNTWDACLENHEAFMKEVTAWMAARDLSDIDALFGKYLAAGATVKNGQDLLTDPHIADREMIIALEDEDLGPVRMQGVVPKLSKSPGKVVHTGPRLGSSNEAIYEGLLGIDKAEMERLRNAGVI